MKLSSYLLPLTAAAVLSTAADAVACDLCAIHNAVRNRGETAGAVDFGLSEQFSYYSRLQQDGAKADNEFHERLQSSITQLTLGYGITEQIGIQAAVPIIVRDFRRIEEGGVDTGRETGLGDTTIAGRFMLYEYETPETTALARFIFGVKLPTGETDRLGEESEEGHHAHERRNPQLLHNGVDHGAATEEDNDGHEEDEHSPVPRSAIHGHDLSLGSGSVDTVFGVNLFAQHERLYAGLDVQYLLRTEGDFDYRYANDLLFNFAPGVFLITEHDLVAAFALNLSGEYKEKDVSGGNKEHDTAITTLALGPEILLQFGERVDFSFAVDLPAYLDNTGLQAMLDYRLRLGLSCRF